jgi:hypothetical protein
MNRDTAPSLVIMHARVMELEQELEDAQHQITELRKLVRGFRRECDPNEEMVIIGMAEFLIPLDYE